ncbi:hypothetical protein DdX_22363 [Ditylenchus destructor]|uniref:Uncharacterized protein n=1 Tax=Ditylenchus destructor TaxID=166010 RepID=A0AAD4MI29_9BILA|nr:hypothetical protein DdX_22363 [Ditylenchus destructor]
MSSKLLIVMAVFMLVIQVEGRQPNPNDECVPGDDSTCPEGQYCEQLVGCAAPPGPCNPGAVCTKRDDDLPRHG